MGACMIACVQKVNIDSSEGKHTQTCVVVDKKHGNVEITVVYYM